MTPKPPSAPWTTSAMPRTAPSNYAKWLLRQPPDSMPLKYAWRDEVTRRNGLGIIEEMLQDARVSQATSVIKSAVVSLGYTLEADPDVVPDPEMAKQMVRFVTYALKRIQGSRYEMMFDLLSCFEYGYSATAFELQSETLGEWASLWTFKRMIPLPIGIYGLDIDDETGIVLGASSQLDVFPSTTPLTDRKVSIERMIYLRHGTRFGGAYGRSQLTRVHPAWWNKQMLRRMRNTGLDRYGAPFALYKVPPNASDPKRAAAQKIIENMHVEGGAVVDEGDKLELIAANNAGIDAIQKAIEYEDCEIVGGIAGSNLGLLEGAGGGGGFAATRVHHDVMLYTVDTLANNLEEATNEQIIARLLEWNFGIQYRLAVSAHWNRATEPEIDALTSRLTQLISLEGLLNFNDPHERNWARARLGLPPASPAMSQPPVDPALQTDPTMQAVESTAAPTDPNAGVQAANWWDLEGDTNG